MENHSQTAQFLAYLRAERAASEHTLANYEIDLHKFAAWLEKPLKRASRLDVQGYISELLTDGASGRTAELVCSRARDSATRVSVGSMMKTYNAVHPHARLINPKTGIDVTARTA